MMKATNFVVFDKSFQASSLGDASLISIVGTIQVLLGVLEELLRQQRREHCRKSMLLNGNGRDAVLFHYETNMVIYSTVHIVWTTHRFSACMNY